MALVDGKDRVLRRASARFQAARDTLDMERAATWRAEAEEILRVIARAGDLPRNPNGKIDRKALASEFLAMKVAADE